MAAEAVNHPRNGILLESNAHSDFDNYRWSVHCPSPGIYQAVKIHPGRRALSFLMPLQDLAFGSGDPGVEMPSAELFNLHLAVGRVLHMSGAGEAIDRLIRDEEELKCTGAWMDGSETAAAILDTALARVNIACEWSKVAGIQGVSFAGVEV